MSLLVGILVIFNIFLILAYELPKRILILKKSYEFIFCLFSFFGKVLDDLQKTSK